MDITIRPALDADADECGRICYEGFRAVNERHGFPPIFSSVEVATRRVAGFIRHPTVFGVVAESSDDGCRIVGFNFLSERDPIRAIGPIVIDPTVQERGIGRRLMEAALERARARLYGVPHELAGQSRRRRDGRGRAGAPSRSSTDREGSAVVPAASSPRRTIPLVLGTGSSHVQADDADDHRRIPRAAADLLPSVLY